MNCKRFDRMLHLYRDGELTDRDAADLREHARTCARCASLEEEIIHTDGYVRTLRGIVPSVDRADELANSVMARIRQNPESTGGIAAPTLVDRLLEFVWRPAVRFACAALVVAAIGSFMVEYLSILRGVEALEQHIATRSGVKSGPVVSYSVKATEIQALADQRALEIPSPFRGQIHSKEIFVVETSTVKSLVSFLDFNAAFLLRGRWDKQQFDALVKHLARHARTIIRFPDEGA